MKTKKNNTEFFMSDFSAEYAALQKEVDQYLAQLNRPAGSVKILAVSKTFPVEAVQEAYNCNVRMFGENKIQELAAKAEVLPKDIEWHFIGHLQSNKAAKAVQYAAWIHSVDSVKLLQKIDRHAAEQGKKVNILLEVNSGEAAKSGVSYADLPVLAEAAKNAENLCWKGLMTMAPLCDNPAVWRAAFEKLRRTRDELEVMFDVTLPELSMGMSGDYPQAVQAGATIIRIGSALFGYRNYQTEN
jgi:pyridoxal phosphate enzyme (YggS family)